MNTIDYTSVKLKNKYLTPGMYDYITSEYNHYMASREKSLGLPLWPVKGVSSSQYALIVEILMIRNTIIIDKTATIIFFINYSFSIHFAYRIVS